MKQLLLLFQHKGAERSKEFLYMKPIVCLSGIYGNKEIASEEIYVSSTAIIPKERLTIHLFIKHSKTRQINCENQGLFNDYYRLFLRIFNADTQQLTTDNIFAYPRHFFIPKTSVPLSQCHKYRLLNLLSKFLFNEQIYEHFYRLKSLNEHAPQSGQAQKNARKGVEFILKKE